MASRLLEYRQSERRFWCNRVICGGAPVARSREWYHTPLAMRVSVQGPWESFPWPLVFWPDGSKMLATSSRFVGSWLRDCWDQCAECGHS